MLIDCGVILGTHNVNDRLSEVIADLVAGTGGRVDVLVITHEHYDHVAAFAGLNSLFCAGDQQPKDGQLQIGEVWFAWTEDPDDPLGQELNKARAALVNQLAAMVGRLQSSNRAMSAATSAMANGITELMSFFGLGAEDLLRAPANLAGQGMAANGAGRAKKHLGATAQAMENARALGGRNGERVRYWKPGDMPWSSPNLPGVRIYALGPPRDEAMLKKTFATNEVYHLAASDAAQNAFFGATAMGGSDGLVESDKWRPFDNTFGRELRDPQQGGDLRMPDATAEFLRRHYYGPGDDIGDQDQSWRRIDAGWLGSAAQFALNLDSATNNTSLVLAIELSPGGEVLLFPADAQVGNWLSWQKVQWTLDGSKTVSATDLLRRTIFYKVGHHGSHNATLREHGLELMPHGLAALLPVDHAMAVEKRWHGLPSPGLIDALRARDATVVSMDDDHLPNDARFRASDRQGSAIPGPLYYEWTLENNSQTSRVDRVTEVVQQLKRVERALGNPILDNFEGIVSVRIFDSSDHDLPITDSIIKGERITRSSYQALPAQNCQVIVQLVRDLSRDIFTFNERIEINDGNNSKVVTFDIALDCEEIDFLPRRASITFKADEASPILKFSFVAPKDLTRSIIFVEVSQKNRLLQSVPAAIIVQQPQ
jgi:hypothetical protein